MGIFLRTKMGNLDKRIGTPRLYDYIDMFYTH
jgi:hypothetical protein